MPHQQHRRPGPVLGPPHPAAQRLVQPPLQHLQQPGVRAQFGAAGVVEPGVAPGGPRQRGVQGLPGPTGGGQQQRYGDETGDAPSGQFVDGVAQRQR